MFSFLEGIPVAKGTGAVAIETRYHSSRARTIRFCVSLDFGRHNRTGNPPWGCADVGAVVFRRGLLRCIACDIMGLRLGFISSVCTTLQTWARGHSEFYRWVRCSLMEAYLV